MQTTMASAAGRSALIMIEFQNEWLDPAGRLRRLFDNAALFTSCASNALAALQAARDARWPVVHTAMGLSGNYQELGNSDFGLRGAIGHYRTWQQHGREIAEAFRPFPDEFVVDRKVAASAFTATPLDMFLRNNNINRIYLTGFALHVCISATGWAAHDLGYEVVVLGDASAAFNSSQQTLVLNDAVHHFGKVLDTQSFINQLGESTHV